jgi:hypothetical protein
VLPDAKRSDVVRKTRELAQLIERALPPTVDVASPIGWPAVSSLLLARIAGQGRTMATLIRESHELDARMVMRSLFEHFALLAWLSIDPSDLPADVAPARTWRAKGPAANTLWWAADQIRREKVLVGKQQTQLAADLLDENYRKALREAKQTFKGQEGWGVLPKLEDMAEEIDARYGGRLEGWADAKPGGVAYRFTTRGMYLLLYQTGNASTHPHLGTLLATFAEPVSQTTDLRQLKREPHGEQVDVVVGISAYLLLYALGIASYIHDQDHVGKALRILDRWDAVRGPRLLLDAARVATGGQDLRRYGKAGTRALSVEREDSATTVTIVTSNGWYRLRHGPQTGWRFDAAGETPREIGPLDMRGAVVKRFRQARELVDRASWSVDSQKPDSWPVEVP